jgi:electron transfer flavoprotein beta subunit
LNLAVVMKQTFDTEEKVAISGGRVSEDGVKFVINPYDEYAVEAALQLREVHGGKVTLLSVGPERTVEAMRTALAMGADEAVLICDDRIGTDEYSVSAVLAAYLTDLSPDLVIGGNFSVDNGSGQIAVRLAHQLKYPHVSSITALDIADGKAVCRRDAEGDTEQVEVLLPAVVTAQQGLNEPRYPSLPGIMKAKKKPFTQLTLDDIGVSVDALTPATETIDISLPAERQAGRILKGELAEQAAALIQHLRNDEKSI